MLMGVRLRDGVKFKKGYIMTNELSVLGYLKDVFARPKVYAKFWTSVLTTVLAILSLVTVDSPLLAGIVAVLGNSGVLAVKNERF